MISLLHVDPDAALQKNLKDYFESSGEICVTSVASAREAHYLLRSQRFDIIIAEYQLPVTNGQAFLEALRRSRKNSTPFIFFAKKADNKAVINALNTGATHFVLRDATRQKSSWS